jgi:hypothetical protein
VSKLAGGDVSVKLGLRIVNGSGGRKKVGLNGAEATLRRRRFHYFLPGKIGGKAL